MDYDKYKHIKMFPQEYEIYDFLSICDLLITDYSSIAYDVFYRGANVVFYWEEKDECLEHYGDSAKLMLNQENVFGDICMNREDLSKVFLKNYLGSQEEHYNKNYKQIVEFQDGNNTERLIDLLKKDRII